MIEKEYLIRFRMKRNAEHYSREIWWAIGTNIPINILLEAKCFAVTVGQWNSTNTSKEVVWQCKTYMMDGKD